MALKFFWRCESNPLDGTNDYTAGDGTPSLNNASIGSTQFKVGSNSLMLTGASSHAIFDISSQDLCAGAEGAYGFWARVGTWQAGAHLLSVYNGGAPNDHITVSLSGTDELEFRYRTAAGDNTACTTNDVNVATGTWYFVVCRWHFANSDMRIEVYDSAGALIGTPDNYDNLAAFGGPGPATAYTDLQVGAQTGANIATSYMDSVMIADTYAEPLEDYLAYTSYTQVGGGGSSAAPLAAAYYAMRRN
jgi:hypothetical protein